MINAVWLVIPVLLILFLLEAFITASESWKQLRNEAIERGFAQYNLRTGLWEWKEPQV